MASPRAFLTGVVTGDTALDTIGARFDRLFDNTGFWLTVTSGGAEGDDVTAEIRDNAASPALDPIPLERGWLTGMQVALAWPATNTGAVTLNVNGAGALNVLTAEGDALTAGQLPAGLLVRMTYLNGALVVSTPLPSASTAGARLFYIFTASGTWTKPLDQPDATAWNVGGWGGGGGGGTVISVGGGGGAYSQAVFRHSDLPSTVSVTIGAGGAAGNPGGTGGNTTFGSLLTAYGAGGRNGAGVLSASTDSTPGRMGGGVTGAGAGNMWAGAGARGGAFLGGGGGGNSGSSAGNSALAGDGGENGFAGLAPGGGGGEDAAGGRGELWIWN